MLHGLPSLCPALVPLLHYHASLTCSRPSQPLLPPPTVIQCWAVFLPTKVHWYLRQLEMRMREQEDWTQKITSSLMVIICAFATMNGPFLIQYTVIWCIFYRKILIIGALILFSSAMIHQTLIDGCVYALLDEILCNTSAATFPAPHFFHFPTL